jgi:hypothetical protein
MKAFQKETDPNAQSVQSSIHSADLDNVFRWKKEVFAIS